MHYPYYNKMVYGSSNPDGRSWREDGEFNPHPGEFLAFFVFLQNDLWIEKMMPRNIHRAPHFLELFKSRFSCCIKKEAFSFA
ncbi:hypothetical protein COU18_03315 [Candidatus Kaiserbacteria bacterium CG10_big_fil_rev_8_21_14_0_10_51_14]|uniref:Uncharacterized protein n=1 Tax=Candidatus Kaiserbacteria bacterium CG10_big_fil_rev_8_21_14_0_10_51_14 TaxID=1974610 RepID=A0A2H0UB96_9BACT|nr:MAG: hypothetical protein COU18_03315 [Candidatus Kaiserbacteria bacterium CG10_big_fil_rev_8_21_14_0_10_51_14]